MPCYKPTHLHKLHKRFSWSEGTLDNRLTSSEIEQNLSAGIKILFRSAVQIKNLALDVRKFVSRNSEAPHAARLRTLEHR